ASERVAHLPPPQQTHDSILKSEIAGEVFEKHHLVARLQYQPQVYGKEPRAKPRRNPAALVLLVGVPDAFDAAIGCCKCTCTVGHVSMVATGMPVVVIYYENMSLGCPLLTTAAQIGITPPGPTPAPADSSRPNAGPNTKGSRRPQPSQRS